jgi:hypothetical protein
MRSILSGSNGEVTGGSVSRAAAVENGRSAPHERGEESSPPTSGSRRFWGSFAVEGNKVTLTTLHRRLSLDRLSLPASYGFVSLESARLNGKPLAVELELEAAGDRLQVRFSPTLEVGEGDRLSFTFRR